MNIQSIILLAVLLCAAIFALIFAIRRKSISKCSGCNGDCSHCHGNFSADKYKNRKNEK